MAEAFRYDEVVKDLFQHDHPTLLSQLALGKKVRAFLNPEFAVVQKRVADLLVLLADGTILHLDFRAPMTATWRIAKAFTR